jgi:hypothetical protein
MYIDITKHAHVYPKSKDCGDNDARKKVVLSRFHVLYLFNTMRYPHTAHVRSWADNKAKPIRAEASVLRKVLGTSASFCFFVNVCVTYILKYGC